MGSSRNYILAVLRGVCLLVIFVAAAIGGGVTLAFDRSRLARARWLQFWSRICNRVLGMSVTTNGEVPSRGMLISNHLGYMDVLALVATTPCIFVAKKEVDGWPVFGFFAGLAGTIYIDRSSRADVARVNKLIGEALGEGMLVVLFPEGTSSDGTGVLPFKSALLQPMIACKSEVTVGAVSYELSSGVAENEVCYWGDMSLLPHLLNLLTRARIYATLAFGAPSRTVGDRKVLSQTLREDVQALKSMQLTDSKGQTAASPNL